MTQRCTNPRNKSYSDYGGRGIRIYFDWVGPGGFASFLNDVGKRPSKKYSLDRIDPDKGYEPDNCRWATKSVQNSNKSGFIYELDGKRFTIYEKAEELGLHDGALRRRISRLMRTKRYTLEEARRIAFTTPNRRKRT
jgi:hypothetical protein